MREQLRSVSEKLAVYSPLIDKLELKVGRWQVRCIDVVMNQLLQHLSSPLESGETIFQQFNRAEPIGNLKLKILKPKGAGGSYRNNAPLFGGELHIRRDFQSSTLDSYTLRLNLSLNPTRFCSFQDTPSRVRGESARELPEQPRLFALQLPAEWHGERTYDGSNNVILKPVAKINSSPALWTRNLNAYIAGITRLLTDAIRNFDEGSPHSAIDDWQYTPEFTVGSCEYYWDIDVDTPLAFVWIIFP